MNLLAHAVLADGSSESIFGNVIADFLRPAEVDRLPPAIRAGVRLHRQVDGFTDRHPVVQRSIARVSRTWGWFSGILIDIYYDHILATEWESNERGSLRIFVDRVHESIAEHVDLIPDPAREWIVRFAESDRFMSYAIPDGSGITSALAGLSLRIAERMPRRAVRLHDAMPELKACHRELAGDFREFFPQVRTFAMAQTNLAREELPRAS